MYIMPRLPGKVTTDADTDPPGPRSSQGRQSQPARHTGDGRDGSPRTKTRRLVRDVKQKISSDIRSVDSGYSETSHCPDVLSPDAVPSNLSFPSMNLGEHHQPPSSVTHRSSSPFSSSVDAVGDIQEHLVHRINRAVGGKDKGKEDSSSMPLPPIPSSVSSSSSSPTSCSLPSDAPEVTENDIKDLLKEMPPDMRVDFQDAMVLYCDDDREKVENFLDHFKEITLFDRWEPKVVLYDEIAISIGSKFKALEFGIERCTYVFLFITKVFCEDSWSEFSSETCLMEAIHNPGKKWCVVPVFTEPKRSASFRVPPSLNSLKGIQYWTNDKFFRDSVQKLLEEKLYIRRKKEKQLTKDRKEWVTKYRIDKMIEEVREEEENLARRKREFEAKRKKELELAEMKRNERKEELHHQHQLRQIESETQMGMQQMMQQFAQRFGLNKSDSDPGVGEPQNLESSTKTAEEMFQYLLKMSGINQQAQLSRNTQDYSCVGHPEPRFYLPSQPQGHTRPFDQVNLATRDPSGPFTAVQEGQALQETRAPSVSDVGSTGFTVPHAARSEASQFPGSAQFFSLPSQSKETRSDSQDFRSLPYGYSLPQNQSNPTTSTCRRETLSQGDPDLEVDQPSVLELLQTSAHPGVSGQKIQQDLRYPLGTNLKSGVDNGGPAGNSNVPLASTKPPDAKEIHYHYHYYQEKSAAKTKEEQAPINIVGAKIVQIGDQNVVKVLDEGELMEGENTEVADNSSDEESSPPGSSVSPRIPGAGGNSASQPPSTIYQDNVPSAPNQQVVVPVPRTESPRPVQLPTRPKETAATDSVKWSQIPSSDPSVQEKSSVPSSVCKPDVASTSVHHQLPAGAIPSTVPTSSDHPSVAPPTLTAGAQTGIAHKDLPSVRTVNPSLHAVPSPHHPVAMVRPLVPAALKERGVADDNTVLMEAKTLASQTVPKGHWGEENRMEFEMAPHSTSLKEREEEDAITEQTLAKQRALESEVD